MIRAITTRRILIVAITLLAFLVVGRAVLDRVQVSQWYAEGRAAAETCDWHTAWMSFRRVVERDPDYGDAEDWLQTALTHAIETVPSGNDVAAEIDLLRYLAHSGEAALLSELLDRSLVTVPAGEFLMGSNTNHPSERPERTVYVDTFAIHRYEVTNAQFQRFVRDTGTSAPRHWAGDGYPAVQADYPVVGISWTEAEAYCTWSGGRLPTEAEWEKTCRGVDGRIYAWGDEWEPSRANVGVSPGGEPLVEMSPESWEYAWSLLAESQPTPEGLGLRPVGSYLDGASPYGVLDLIGNTAEYAADWYTPDGYWELPDVNPQSVGPRYNHVVRGGSWYSYFPSADWVSERSRCATRNWSHSADEPRAGLRCVFPVP